MTLIPVKAGDPHIKAHNDERSVINQALAAIDDVVDTNVGRDQAVRVGLAGADFYDDFGRPNTEMTGTQSASGHIYRPQNPDTCYIVDGKYTPTVGPGQTSIAYVDLAANPEAIHATFVFNGPMKETGTGSVNAVVGASRGGFNLGSIQLACWSSATDDEVSDSPNDWQIFGVSSSDYVLLLNGLWANDFVPQPGIPYDITLRRIGPDTVMALLPDGTIRVVTHSLVSQYWGSTIGYQVRRGTSSTGTVSFLHNSASTAGLTEPPQPTPGRPISFDGTVRNFIQSIPKSAISNNLEIRLALSSYSPSATSTVACRWGSLWGNAWYLNISSARNLSLGVSIGGATTIVSTTTGGSSPLPSTAAAFAVTRDASTGDVNFYYTTLLAALDLPLTDSAWTLLRTQTGPTGNLDISKAPLMIARPNGSDSSNWYVGQVIFAGLYDGVGGAARAKFDTRGRWTGIDEAGVRWSLVGTRVSWYPGGITLPPGLLTSRPLAASVPDGTTYLAIDVNGGTTYSSLGSTWLQNSSSVNGSTVFKSVLGVTQTVSNVNTVQTAWTPPVLGAGSLVAGGTVVRLRLHGDLDTAASGDTFLVYPYVNGVQLAAIAVAPSQTTAATNVGWTTDFEIYVDLVGASGAVSVVGTSVLVTSSAGAVGSRVVQVLNTPVDLTTGLGVSVKMRTSTASTSNIIRLKRATLVQVA